MTAASSHVNHRRPEAGRLHRPFRAAALVALAGALAFAAQVALAQAPTRLTKVELQPQPGNQLEVKLVLDGPAPQPVAFTIDNPARLAVDLPGTAVALESRRIDVKSGGVDSIVAAEASGRTRVVFNLDSLQPYSTRTEGNNVYVTLGSAAGNQPAAATVSTAAAPAAASGSFAVEKVDFRRGADGAGRIIVRTSDPRVQASVRQEGGRTVVDFPRTSVAPEAARRYDVVDFATPVNSFDVIGTPNGARIVVNATGEYEQLGYQSDREYVLELRQRSKAAAVADPGKKEYRGERLTLNFQDIETRAVLQLLAETSGQNIVVSDTVQGNVTLRLQNVPWDQALDIVMRTKGLDKRQEGNVIYVAPSAELAAREKQLLESQKSLTELAPVRTEYLQVNYAKASDLASLIKSQGKSSLLSERGSLAIDERTNTLLLQDTADRLADIRRLVQTLDIPVKQVLIEARIVIVNDDFSRELGVRFGGAFVGNYGSNDGLMYVSNSGLNSADGDRGPIISPNGPGGVGIDGNQVATGAGSLPGQPADRQPGRPPGHDAARLRLRGRPRNHGRAARRPR